jgi:hypothetical protein
MECRDAPAERPRPSPGQALSRSLVALDQNSTIIAVIEMSQSSWLVAGVLPSIERQPRKKLELTRARTFMFRSSINEVSQTGDLLVGQYSNHLDIVSLSATLRF